MFKKSFKNVYVYLTNRETMLGKKKCLKIHIVNIVDDYTKNSILINHYIKNRNLKPEKSYNMIHADSVNIDYNEYGIQNIDIDGLYLVKSGKPYYSEYYDRDKYCIDDGETLCELKLDSENYVYDTSYEEISISFIDNLKNKGKRLLESAKKSLDNQNIKIEKRNRKTIWNKLFIKNKI